MGDNDMIRRGDALALPPYDGDGDPAGQWDHHIFVRRDAIAALPAVSAPAEDAIAKGETPGEMLDRLGMDGVKWAAEFRTTALRLGYSDMDEGWLIGWFCNAIMAGYDRAPVSAPVAVRVDVPPHIWVGVSERGDLAINHRGEKLNGYSDHALYTLAAIDVPDVAELVDCPILPRETEEDYERRLSRMKPAPASTALRITGPNSDGEYWLHINVGGRSGGINLGAEHGPICKRLLDAASELPAVSAPVVVRVKPLEWEEEPDRDPNYPKWTADTGMGKHYFVFKAWWGSQQKWGFAGVDGFYHTKDEAKAAAQSDYAARIMAAIDAPDVAELVEALSELRAMLIDHGFSDEGQLVGKVDAALARIGGQ
jgi:hypothetical protein